MARKWNVRWKSLFATAPALVGMAMAGCGGDNKQATTEQLVAEMSQRIAAITTAEQTNGVIPRFNQPKTIGCVRGEFRVHEDIPGELKQGIFAEPKSYPAMLRFASATQMNDAKKDIRGVSIKVSDIEGESLWGKPGTQDFLFNSYPALFVATPEEFLAFIRARQDDKKIRFFLNPLKPHLKSLWIVFKARKKHLSPFDIRYFSTVPFAHGTAGNLAVKYSLTPCSDSLTKEVVEPGDNQLRAAMGSHLQNADACFQFGIQTQADAQKMPIEDASVIWDGNISPFVPVATVIIKNQEFASNEALSSCERTSFNPWQSLAAHEPLGRMNEVRRLVYEQAAKLRNKE